MDWVYKLVDTYGYNKPLTFEDLQTALPSYSKQRVYQLIDKAVNEKRLMRFEVGIYYAPMLTCFGLSKLDPSKVVSRKYVTDCKETYGYYSGLSLLNGLELTTQVPNVIEVVTNKEASRLREIYIGKQKVRLRKARVPINRENVDALMILDLFNQVSPIANPSLDWGGVIAYVRKTNLSLNKIMAYSYAYPAKAVKNLMNSVVAYALVWNP